MLRTERLLLRSFAPEDAGDVLVYRGDPEVQRFNAETLKTLDESRAFIEEMRRTHLEFRGLEWAMEEIATGRMIGGVCLGPWDEWHHWAVLGYDLRRDRWGRGFAFEAAARVIRFGFETMQLHRIESHTIADNHRSVRLLERLGFTREGTRREKSLEDDGRYHDSSLWGLLRTEIRSG